MPSAANEGYCAECGNPCDREKIWCDLHRKTGAIPGLDGRTYEDAERNHGDRIRDYHRKESLF